MGKWPNALISLLQRIHAILPGGRELHTKVAHKNNRTYLFRVNWPTS